MNQPLLDQIASGRSDLVFDFLEAGNAADAKDENGVSVLQWCAYYGDVSAIKYLVLHGARLDSLGVNYDLNGAVFHGHVNLSAYLIEQGADVNQPLSDTGETPLHAALCTSSREKHDAIIEMLIAHGADPNCKTTVLVPTGSFMRDIRTRAETPLHRAAAFGNEKTIQMLIDAGAIVEVKDCNGDTPLTWASWHLRPRSILRLLCYGPFRVR